MNGAPRSGDRPTRDQQADAPAPPTNSEANRRTMFALPSLRGTDSHSPSHSPSPSPLLYAHQAQAQGYSQAHATPAASANSFSAAPASQAPPPPPADKLRLGTAGTTAATTAAGRFGRPRSTSNSQDTNMTSSTNESDLNNSNVFTPPASLGDGAPSAGIGTGHNSHNSSQESQLFQLSQLAAAQEKMPADGDMMVMSPVEGGISRKRLADGTVKAGRDDSSASPVYGAHRGGHSRNTSTVSVASTAGSRLGELSAEFKARLSYAMVKVNHGWQAHNIDQVESLSLASQTGSPSSTASTIHRRNGSSSSPRLPGGLRHSNNASPTEVGVVFGQEATQSYGHMLPGSSRLGKADHTAPPLMRPGPSLAPPVSIQPSRSTTMDARRNSNPPFNPPFLSQSGFHGSPRTHVERGSVSVHGTPQQLTARTESMVLASPHQNVREQDAIESLLFMSSPGNSANLKHAFPASSSQPVVSSRTGQTAPGGSHPPPRTALPTGQPRKSLPTGRPTHHSQPVRRVNFEKSTSNLSELSVDDHLGGSPYSSRGTSRRKVNGHGEIQHRHTVSLSKPTGLSAPSKRRPVLTEEDIDKMLDSRVAEDSSDSEGEIQIPGRRPYVGMAARS